MSTTEETIFPAPAAVLVLGPDQKVEWLEQYAKRLTEDAEEAGDAGRRAVEEFGRWKDGESSLSYEQMRLQLSQAEHDLPEEVDYYGRRSLRFERYEVQPDFMLRRVGFITLRQFHERVKAHLKRTRWTGAAADEEYPSLYQRLDYLSPNHREHMMDEQLPYLRGFACYAVTGGSEGHYIHVETVGHEEDHTTRPKAIRRHLLLAKTFDGFDCAYEVAREIARYIGA